MKKQILGILIILSLGAFSWAQGSTNPFDVKKSQEELEIMKGILKTTLSIIGENDSQMNIRRNPAIDAFYLADQGAVFVIPLSSPPYGLNLEISRALDATRESLNELRQNLDFETLYDGTLALPAPPAPPAPPALPVPQMEVLEDGSLVLPAPQMSSNSPESTAASQEEHKKLMEKQRKALELARANAEKSREEARKKREEALKEQKAALELYKERSERNREEARKRREKLAQSLADINVHLVETLANYGDSLTTVQSHEYINLVLSTEDPESRSKRRSNTISVRKSMITDYKAGRISLEDFKQNVLQYTQ